MNSRRRILAEVFIPISVSVILTACNGWGWDVFNYGGAATTGDNGNSVNPAAVNYAFVNANIFQPHCVSCHSNAGGNPGGVNLETYANVVTHLSDIRDQVNTNQMPKGGPPLTDTQKTILNDWISLGAPEN